VQEGIIFIKNEWYAEFKNTHWPVEETQFDQQEDGVPKSMKVEEAWNDLRRVTNDIQVFAL
jgi:hypothetical protein